MPKLSIIIPCYNCEKTLRQAVDSCFTQGLRPDEFEIIMVDDASTDGTATVIQSICEARPEIRHSSHEKNKGGGAARNSGIRMAHGHLIYCLDSDNFFAPDSIKPLMQKIESEGVDGAAFHRRRFFSHNPKKYVEAVNHITDRVISLGDLFTEPSILLDNFMFTKESFNRTEGFPEHHGFDTQGFEMRYLAAGNTVSVCANSVFYHRQAASTPSYFEREYNAGNFSLNYYLCIEDIFELLTETAQSTVLRYDIFKNSSLSENLLAALKQLHAKGLLLQDPHTIQQTDASRAIAAYKSGDFKKAFDDFGKLLTVYPEAKVIYYNLLRAGCGMSGTHPVHIEKEVSTLITGMRTRPTKLYKAWQHHSYLAPFISFFRTCKAKLKK